MDRLYRPRSSLIPGFLVSILLTITFWSSATFAATNIAVDGGGASNLLPSDPVIVNPLAGGAAVTSAVAEINPSAIIVNSLANSFTVDILPEIIPGDTGLNQVVIDAPPGFIRVGGTPTISVGGIPLTFDCALDTADDYCFTEVGQTLTFDLQSKVTTTATNIRIGFTADAPPITGSGTFNVTIDDTATGLLPPQIATAGDADSNAANSNSLTVTTTLSIPDPSRSTVTAIPVMVLADGASTSTITTTIVNGSNTPLNGKDIQLSSSRGGIDSIIQPAAPTDISGIATGTVSSFTPGAAVITATDTTDGVVLTMTPTIYFTQGQVLEISKTADRNEAVVGEIITYHVIIKNLPTSGPVSGVRINDLIPPNFKYLKNSARLNGVPPPEPVGNRQLIFNIGAVPALIDTNGNGTADPGEAGYLSLSYQLIIGSGASPGSYTNTAMATDACDQCLISNQDEAVVEVTIDPLFDLGTIIGKVFRDHNRDGWQSEGENGIGGAMVALDNGSYVLTDDHGRYHFPAVTPGHRLLKINLSSLPGGAEPTTGETRIVSVTPGLLAKVNFGVAYDYLRESIGRKGEKGLRLKGREKVEPFQVTGNVTSRSLMINGKRVELPSSDIQMSFAGITDIVTIKSGELEKPIEFYISSDNPEPPETWQFDIFASDGQVIKSFDGKGYPPSSLVWDGKLADGKLLAGGNIYQFQMESRFANTTTISSPRKFFGVNISSTVALNLAGGAFLTGSDQLSAKAEAILRDTARILQEHPGEKIIIEGHTDSVGDKDYNLELSKKRAQAAAAFLMKREGIAPNRFVVNWYGETKPLASNLLDVGRKLNRRVEIKGEIVEIDRAALHDQYRATPGVEFNDQPVEVDAKGRFTTEIAPPEGGSLGLEMSGPQGDNTSISLSLPYIEITSPGSEGKVLPLGPDATGQSPEFAYRITGRTGSGNTFLIDGKEIAINDDGTFHKDVLLHLGANQFGMIAANPDGLTAITNLNITVTSHEDTGLPVMFITPIPYLEVSFPRGDAPLRSSTIEISGRTYLGNSLAVNDREVDLNPDGSFTTRFEMAGGEEAITVTVTDGDGYQGSIRKEVSITKNEMFYLAFADAKISQLDSKGYIEGSGVDGTKDYYTEGRLSFYLKGRIRGKYLLTAAFDSGTNEFDRLFDSLDKEENNRLLTNIDPDKLYPVYGDSSTIVYDTDSNGKLYLALESDEFGLLVGNYRIELGDTELATFNRTLYGARARYQSVATTKYGQPNTTIILFGVEIAQEHIRNSLRATGGSLYYL
ncbi:MAG: OmpA family protein, partial [Thermodesulfobacteriota bacterium]